MFFHVKSTKSNQMVPNQENMVGNQLVQIHGHAQWTLQPQTCEQEHFSDETDTFFGLIVFCNCFKKLVYGSPLIVLPF